MPFILHEYYFFTYFVYCVFKKNSKNIYFTVSKVYINFNQLDCAEKGMEIENG